MKMAAEKSARERARMEAMAIEMAARERYEAAMRLEEGQRSKDRTLYLSKQRKLRSAKEALQIILNDLPINKEALKQQLDFIMDLKREIANIPVPLGSVDESLVGLS